MSGEEARPEEGHWLPGVRPVLELLRLSPHRADVVFIRKGRRDRRTEEIVDLCRSAGVRFRLLSADEFRRAYAGSSQGVAARLFESGFSSLEEAVAAALAAPLPLLLVLDRVLDPGNVGTLARTLYALGGGGLILPRHQSAYLGAGAARSAAGAMHRLPVVKVANLAQTLDVLAQDFAIYGAICAGEMAEPSDQAVQAWNIYAFRPRFPAVLVLGGEEKGLRPGVAKRCAQWLHIPMVRDFDSLNVAQAGAILIASFSSARLREEAQVPRGPGA
ncbi:MAG: 23S rRNA (guanosine(2251)-2'-O)-methyltransferase RlmB [Deltaproteobacteria bacterium]|nr:23S rRNA (guanosine(2251)-2'-O)-methyltransferase RlmB [Deltaproteobacteria bacterium]